MDLKNQEDASLELEEVRAVFRALHSGPIRPVWLNERIFTDRVREHLGLVLRQQRGRFLQTTIRVHLLTIPQTKPLIVSSVSI